jgi:hypothetical protein
MCLKTDSPSVSNSPGADLGPATVRGVTLATYHQLCPSYSGAIAVPEALCVCNSLTVSGAPRTQPTLCTLDSAVHPIQH